MQTKMFKHFPYQRPYVFSHTALPTASFITRKNSNNYEQTFGIQREDKTHRPNIPSKLEFLTNQEDERIAQFADIFKNCPRINKIPELNPRAFNRQPIFESELLFVHFARWNDDFHIGVLPSKHLNCAIKITTGQDFYQQDFLMWQNVFRLHQTVAGGIEHVTEHLCQLADTFDEQNTDDFIKRHGFNPNTLLDNASLIGHIQTCIEEFQKLPEDVISDYVEAFVEIKDYIQAKLTGFSDKIYVVTDNNFLEFETLNDRTPKVGVIKC